MAWCRRIVLVMVACIALTTVCFAGTSSKPTRMDLLKHLDAGRKSASWKPSQAYVALAKTVIAGKSEKSWNRAAAAFCLAKAKVDVDTNVEILVQCAKKSVGATRLQSTGEQVGDALFVLWRSGSARALKHIVTLKLDGARGEILAQSQAEAFCLAPVAVARIWSGLPTDGRESFVSGAAMGQYTSKMTKALQRAKQSKNKQVRSLAKAILAVPD